MLLLKMWSLFEGSQNASCARLEGSAEGGGTRRQGGPVDLEGSRKSLGGKGEVCTCFGVFHHCE